MTVWGYIFWVVFGILALFPIVGLIATFLEWYRNKVIDEYERGHRKDE